MARKFLHRLAVLTGVALLALPFLGAAETTSPSDLTVEQAVNSKLQQKKQLRDVRATVDDGVLTLQGSVARYQDKLDAEKRARKAAKAADVRDLVEVSSTAPDEQLRARLARSLAYDRVGYGNLFNVIELGVDRGVVTLKGEVLTGTDKDSALALAARTPGVKAVVDRLTVSPASIMDDELRIRAARAIYGDPVLTKYAMDPQAPIRILVHNGRVGLYGTVDSAMDKQVAMMRASSLFGAFAVENHLVAAGDAAR